MVFVGADAVSARGDLYNKVGTAMVAHLAHESQVPFYSAAELYKYSPASLFGNQEKIEQRDAKEVWDKAPKGVKIINPAFDVTTPDLITGFITEEGVISPQSFFSLASQKTGVKL
jgi:translation initiation factor 2B subunit (eIF-2B alpha/beta/delta family)